MSKISYIIAFSIGSVIGSVATWAFVKSKYEMIAQEEIESVKETFSNKKQPVYYTSDESIESDNKFKEMQQKAELARNKPDVNEYAKMIMDNEYRAPYNEMFSAEEHEEDMDEQDVENDKPYVITPDEFGEKYEYDNVSLTYYADGMLAYDDDRLVEDVEGLVGIDSLNTFGQYERDSVFVRNDRVKCDFEILLDQREYLEVIDSRPYLAEE